MQNAAAKTIKLKRIAWITKAAIRETKVLARTGSERTLTIKRFRTGTVRAPLTGTTSNAADVPIIDGFALSVVMD